jgi:hypothetical protein
VVKGCFRRRKKGATVIDEENEVEHDIQDEGDSENMDEGGDVGSIKRKRGRPRKSVDNGRVATSAAFSEEKLSQGKRKRTPSRTQTNPARSKGKEPSEKVRNLHYVA